MVLPIIIWGCGDRNETASEEHADSGEQSGIALSKSALEKIDIQTVQVRSSKLRGTLTVPAKVIADQNNEAQIGSLVQGRVHKIFKNLGDYVKAGEPLMQIEGLEIGEIKSQFLKAKAQLVFTEANLKRQNSLYEQNAGSQKALNEAQAEYDKALAEFNAEDKRIHSVGLTDEDMEKEAKNSSGHDAGTLTIKSPISGVITERNVVLGQFIDASAISFRIINTSSLWVEGQVYENDIQSIGGKPEIVFAASSLPKQEFKGRVFFIGQIVDEHTRTIPVRAEISNKAGMLRPQMFGSMKVELSGSSKGIVIPTETIIKDKTENYIFIAINDTAFTKREVVLGAEINGHTEIISGISDGEQVVVKGSFFLKSEMMKDSLAEEE
jgi:cobalt-zinc-cadmium efflux system membrane fusion protein